MGLFDFLTKKKNEYMVPGADVETVGIEFNFPEDCELTPEGNFVLTLKQKKDEKAKFEEFADAVAELSPDLPRYTFKCAKCKTLYLITDMENFHILVPTDIQTVCRNCFE